MRFRESGGTSGRGTWVARWNDNWRCVLGKIPWERGGVGREARGIGQGQGGAPFPDGEAGVRRYAKIRYRALARNKQRLALLFGLGNLLLRRRVSWLDGVGAVGPYTDAGRWTGRSTRKGPAGAKWRGGTSGIQATKTGRFPRNSPATHRETPRRSCSEYP